MNIEPKVCPTTHECKCGCHAWKGYLLFLFGLNFLLANLGIISIYASNIIWPSLLILAGLACIFKGMCKCCSRPMV